MERKKKQTIKNMAITDHLKELRKVILISAYAIAAGSIGGWLLSDYTYKILAKPIEGISQTHFITTTPMEPILVKLQVSLVVGVIIALPIILWQIWSFILPALKENEKKYVYFIVPPSLILFLTGASFSFLVVLPMGLKFLLLAGSGVESTPFVTMSSYLRFIITFLLSFGLVFQLPILLLLLIRIGVISPDFLARKRKWAFFIIIVLSAIISPTPDLVTQLLMAGPMYMLYEVSIWLGYLITRKKKRRQIRLNNQERGIES
ncbi:MAG: twin-arginine translocase subunit TatC [Peptococcaceae bacterium]|nr:twin-arginine translocase subunit TatC [Peptococcaceae bacterium]